MDVPRALRASAEAAVARRLPGCCPLAAASGWSLRAFAALTPRPARAALRALAAGGDAAATAPFWRGFDAALAPAARAASEAARVGGACGLRLAPRVAWGNLAVRLAWLLEGWEADPDAATRRAAAALRAATLDGPTARPDGGGPNPLAGAVSYVPSATSPSGRARLRRTCCLRDRAGGLSLCASCPRLGAAAREAALAASYAAAAAAGRS